MEAAVWGHSIGFLLICAQSIFLGGVTDLVRLRGVVVRWILSFMEVYFR
jgi:hypothetical protein